VVVGEDRVSGFAREHAGARKPLQRFLHIAGKAERPHFPAVKRTFATTDYAPETGTPIFDIGGNKYRLNSILLNCGQGRPGSGHRLAPYGSLLRLAPAAVELHDSLAACCTETATGSVDRRSTSPR